MVDTSILDNPKNDIGFLIWRISKAWHREKNKTLSEFGLTLSQLEILGAVYHSSKMDNVQVTQIMLSKELAIDPMTTSTILRNLQKKGFISRKESTIDTRARIVEITEEGTQIFVKAIIKVKSIQNQIFANFDKTQMEQNLQYVLDELEMYSKRINN